MKSIASLFFCILSAQMTYAANVSQAETNPPDQGQEVQQLNTKIQGQLKAIQDEQKKEMSTLNTQLQQQLKQMHTEMQEQIKQLQTSIQSQITQIQKQTKH